MDEWLTRARDALAEASGTPRERLVIDHDTEVTLLDLARIAARESGARTNAPLLCYLVGRAQASGTTVDELASAVRSAAG